MAKITHKCLSVDEMADCESLMRQSNRVLRYHQSMLPKNEITRDMMAGKIMRSGGEVEICGRLISASECELVRASGHRREDVFAQFGDMLANLANKFASGSRRGVYCSDDRFDNYYQESVIGINTAYWYYTDPSVKFITFAHTAVQRRLIRFSEGLPLDPAGLIRNVKSSVRVISEIGRSDADNPTDIAAPENNMTDIMSLREAVAALDLNPLEKFVFDGFHQTEGNRGWAKRLSESSYNPETGKPYSVPTITMTFDRIKERLAAMMS